MEDVLDVYSRPYDKEYPVVCFDESPKQLVSELRKPYIGKDGVKYEDCEYKREGAAELMMITEPLGGKREVLVREDHTGITWALIMAYIVETMYPAAKIVTIVMDNLSAHKIHNLYKVFDPIRARAIRDRLAIVYTPKHGSWLNIAECELSVLSRQALKKRFASKEELEKQVKAWEVQRNDLQKEVDWQFTTKDARVKLRNLYLTVLT
jgi:transposase